jgi:hypothetical protein
MKHVLVLFGMLATLASVPAMAETAQQNRMKECNAQASGKTGDAHKAFMSSCLKGDAPAAASGKELTPQQQRMRDCNAEAKGKSGDARKKFMSKCLKGKN